MHDVSSSAANLTVRTARYMFRQSTRWGATPHLWAAAGYFALALLALHPLVAGFASVLPDYGDSFHNIWTWGDTINRLRQGRGLFDVNIYYSIPHAGAFQELQLLNTLVFAPFFLLADNPVLGHNVVLLCGFVFSGVLTYAIAYVLSRHAGLAFLAGVIFTFFPYRFAHLFHVQVLTFQWVLLPLLLLILYLRTSRRWLLVLFFVAYTAQIVSVAYNTVYLIVLVWGYTLLHVLLAGGSRENRRRYLAVLGVLLGAFVVAVPFYLPYLSAARAGFVRSDVEIRDWGVDILLFFVAPPGNVVYGKLTENIRAFQPLDGHASAMFPGFIVLALTAIAVVRIRRERLWRSEQRTEVVFFAMVMLTFFVLALGPVIKFRGQDVLVSPFFLAFENGSPFRALRYVPNHIQPALFALAVLVAVVLARHAAFQSRRVAPALVAALILLVAAEYTTRFAVSAPIPTGDQIPQVYRWLKEQKTYPVVELPVPARVAPAEKYFSDQMLYMYYSIYHGFPILNGITGFVPPEYATLVETAATFPSSSFVQQFYRAGFRYVILHHDLLPTPPDPQRITARYPMLRSIYLGKDATVFFIGDSMLSQFQGPTSLKPGILRYELSDLKAPTKAKAGSQFTITARVRNLGDTLWLADTREQKQRYLGEVRFGISRWIRISDGMVPWVGQIGPLGARGRLPEDMFPGDEIQIPMPVPVPDQPGEYIAEVNMVDEGVTWFPQAPTKLTIKVE